jgi:hypothetical protein
MNRPRIPEWLICWAWLVVCLFALFGELVLANEAVKMRKEGAKW